MDNKELFSRKSDDYALYRPSYPEEAVQFLRSECSGSHVVDIGAGTGIFTKVLLKYFDSVAAVEPNGDMREKFKAFLPDIPCLAGSGEETTLPDASVDLITVAQAFHWLDEEKFKQEAIRILRPGGKVAIVWNTTLKNDFTVERDNICKKYSPRFRSGHAGKRTPAEGDAFLRFSYFKHVKIVCFSNPFVMDRIIFEGNMRSRSYIPSPGEVFYGTLMEELRALFEKYAVKGKVTEEIATQIYLGSFE